MWINLLQSAKASLEPPCLSAQPPPLASHTWQHGTPVLQHHHCCATPACTCRTCKQQRWWACWLEPALCTRWTPPSAHRCAAAGPSPPHLRMPPCAGPSCSWRQCLSCTQGLSTTRVVSGLLCVAAWAGGLVLAPQVQGTALLLVLACCVCVRHTFVTLLGEAWESSSMACARIAHALKAMSGRRQESP